MGVWYATYIGPYVRVPLIKTEDVKARYACSGSCGAMNLSAANKFCSNCGQAVKKVELRTPVTRPAHPHDLKNDALGEMMWMPESSYSDAKGEGQSIWLPNRGGHGVTLDRERSESVVDITDGVISQALFRFQLEYSAFLEAVENELGVKPEVRYGAIFYAN